MSPTGRRPWMDGEAREVRPDKGGHDGGTPLHMYRHGDGRGRTARSCQAMQARPSPAASSIGLKAPASSSSPTNIRVGISMVTGSARSFIR